MEFNDHLMFAVVYELNLDLVTYSRTVYSFLEWVAEIGGLTSALLAVFAIINQAFMY